jgi:hypothetical protein
MSIVRRPPNTPVMLSCTTCKEALQNIASSHSLRDFLSRISDACRDATSDESENSRCVQTLYQHNELLFANQRRFIPSEASCYRIKATNCRPVIIMCDQRKKKGYCHVIH